MEALVELVFKFLIVLSLSIPASCMAALGQSKDSVERESQELGATHTESSANNYTIYEIKNSFLSIREYVATNGVVFAVSWRGVTHPDLARLFGSYHADFQQAYNQRPLVRGRLHQPVRVMGAKIVVRFAGHMRDVQGHSYIPELVPTGVNAESLP